MDDKIKNKSLAKSISILECFLDHRQLGITDLSRTLGYSKSSIHDTVSTLEALGYLNQDPSTEKYYLGVNCMRLGRAALVNYTFRDIASKHIRAIADEVGEACYLTIPYGHRVYFMDVAVPSNSSHLLTPALSNSTDPMHCTSSGKCMLAASSDKFVEDYIASGLERRTEYTITEPNQLRAELKKIRAEGYAVDNMEYSIGIRCVARPIILSDGTLAGAISISGPSPRMTDEKILKYERILKEHICTLTAII